LRTPDRYIDAVAQGVAVEAASETLDAETRRVEGLQLALRTRGGVPREAFDSDTIRLLAEMLVPHPSDPTRMVLTSAGRLMANDISMRMR